ncbi:AsmA family protein [Aquibium carbonis]|uniref:AsmA family protein n=1 Tax=Aquibium carbonis TaxID=2495581 RepID=A0A3S0G9X2_9HYPH|nr:AsmA-like C-terminal region-containing protein [Aquibium carbonis]RST87042.1 AsmA family protein [Aquibium carbonis]
MPSKAAKRTIWIFAGLAVFALGFIALIPYVASTQIVRNRIASELSAWSGYRVVLSGIPSLHVWPSFHAELADVSLQEWGRPDEPPVLRAERIDIELSPIAALRGEIAFTKVALLRPVLRVSDQDSAIPFPVPPRGGRMLRAIETARAVVDENPAQPDTARMPSDPLGALEFVDGRVLRVDADGEHEVLSSITGRGAWNTLQRPASVSLKAIWRGEGIAVEAGVQQPLALLAGGNSRVSVSLSSSPLTGSFEGLATFSRRGFVDGVAKLSSPSLRRALEWSRADISPGAVTGNASISGRLIGDAQRMKLEGAQLSFGGHPGNGLLDFSFAGAMPALSGTLAFQSLDMRAFLGAFVQLPDEQGRWNGPIELDFSRQLQLDLRLSAARATAGQIELGQLAATAQINEGLAAFDISDSTAFGGAVQASLRIDRRDADQAEIRFLASDVDFRAFGAATGLGAALPQAKATISAIISGPADNWESMLAGGGGSISVKLGQGSVAWFDLDAFRERASTGGFFPLRDMPAGTIAFESAEFRSTVMSGVARLDTAKVKQARQVIAFTGILPLVGQGIALSGTILPRDPAEAVEPKPTAQIAPLAAFFVGGSWRSPFVSPILSDFPLE